MTASSSQLQDPLVQTVYLSVSTAVEDCDQIFGGEGQATCLVGF